MQLACVQAGPPHCWLQHVACAHSTCSLILLDLPTLPLAPLLCCTHNPQTQQQQLIEKLYRSRWTKLDGMGALVLTPTRELALQIFEELVKVRVVCWCDAWCVMLVVQDIQSVCCLGAATLVCFCLFVCALCTYARLSVPLCVPELCVFARPSR